MFLKRDDFLLKKGRLFCNSRYPEGFGADREGGMTLVNGSHLLPKRSRFYLDRCALSRCTRCMVSRRSWKGHATEVCSRSEALGRHHSLGGARKSLRRALSQESLATAARACSQFDLEFNFIQAHLTAHLWSKVDIAICVA